MQRLAPCPCCPCCSNFAAVSFPLFALGVEMHSNFGTSSQLGCLGVQLQVRFDRHLAWLLPGYQVVQKFSHAQARFEVFSEKATVVAIPTQYAVLYEVDKGTNISSFWFCNHLVSSYAQFPVSARSLTTSACTPSLPTTRMTMVMNDGGHVSEEDFGFDDFEVMSGFDKDVFEDGRFDSPRSFQGDDSLVDSPMLPSLPWQGLSWSDALLGGKNVQTDADHDVQRFFSDPEQPSQSESSCPA
eukprot:3231218-Rhodomonas_salina.1